MVRTRRSAKLDTRHARSKLKTAQNHMEPLSKGQYLIYRKPKNGSAGSWSACFVNPETKKQTRTHIGTADDYQDANNNSILTFSQAQTKAGQWFKAMDRQVTLQADGEILPEGIYTVANAIEAYFQDGQRTGKKSIKTARNVAKTWILPYFGHIQVIKLTRIKIEHWLDKMANTPKRLHTKAGLKQQYAPPPQTDDQKRARKVSANGALMLLKASLTWAVERRLVDAPERPWQLVRRFRGVDKARIRYLSPEEQIKLVSVCTGDFKALVRGALLTGCRYGELTRLKTKDYDPKNGTILISESKSGKPRHIYLTEEGITLFNELTRKRDQETLIFTTTIPRRTRTNNEQQNAWMANDTIRFIREACKKAGLEKITFHELRHTYASTLMNKGVPLVYVAAQLGHANTNMVEKHYGHIAPNAMAQAIRQAIPRLGLLEPSIPKKAEIANTTKKQKTKGK